MSKPITSPPVWYIYSLSDPLADGAVRYVGKTTNLKKRALEHTRAALAQKEHNHRTCWLRHLISCGANPSLSVLETGQGDWKEAEQRWIKNLKAGGADLVNSTAGGEGLTDPSPETRARIGAISKGRRHTAETRARLSLSHRGHPVSAETRAKIAEANRRRIISLETRQKMSISGRERVLGRQRSFATRIKIALAHTGKRHTLETRAKLSAIGLLRRRKQIL